MSPTTEPPIETVAKESNIGKGLKAVLETSKNRDMIEQLTYAGGLRRGSNRRLLNYARHLLVSDPLSSLASSGFSYVVVTAVKEDFEDSSSQNKTEKLQDSVQNAAIVGASALSRIRTIEAVADEPGSDQRRLHMLWDVLFWSFIAVSSTFVLHLFIISIFRWRDRTLPKMLHLPRMELLVFMMTLPMIAAAGAGLLRAQKPGFVVIGVLFGILIPFGFLVGAAIFVSLQLLRPAVDRRRAVYVVYSTSLDREDNSRSSLPANAVNGNSELDAEEYSRTSFAAYGSNTSSRENSLTSAMLWGEGSHLPINDGGLPAESQMTAHVQNGNESAEHESNNELIANSMYNQTSARSTLKKLGHWMYNHFLKPMFGFKDAEVAADDSTSASTAVGVVASHARAAQLEPQWLGRIKGDMVFVKRYGCLFEDTHGPQVSVLLPHCTIVVRGVPI